MATKKNEALTTIDSSRFAVCDPAAAGDLAALLAGGVGVFDLTRLKVPASGATAWEIDRLDGVTYEKELECVIVLVQGGQRAWWRNAYGAGGGGTPPDCSSTGGGIGVGNTSVEDVDEDTEPVTQQCATCHWNQWKTATRPDGSKGRGKACKEWAMVFLYIEGGGIPMMLSVPPSSLGTMRQYSIKLMGAGKKVSSVLTKISLAATKNGDGTDYSEVEFAYAGDLSPEGAAAADASSELLKEYLATHTIQPDLG